MPDLAAMAFCSAVYCLSPVPALTRLILTFGYLVWKSAATFLRVGSHAHTVMSPPVLSAAWMSASDTVEDLAAPLEPLEAVSSEEPQAVATSVTDRAAPMRRARRRDTVMVFPFIVLPGEGSARRAGGWSLFDASGRQARLPVPLEQQERRDQRDDGE